MTDILKPFVIVDGMYFTSDLERTIYRASKQWFQHCRNNSLRMDRQQLAMHKQCSVDCELYQIPGMEFYICPKSGQYHICGEAVCNARTMTEDMYVCVITGAKFHADERLDTFEEGKRIERIRLASKKRQLHLPAQLDWACSTVREIERCCDDDKLVSISELLEEAYGKEKTNDTPAPRKPIVSPFNPVDDQEETELDQNTIDEKDGELKLSTSSAVKSKSKRRKKSDVASVVQLSGSMGRPKWLPKETRHATVSELSDMKQNIEFTAKRIITLFFESETYVNLRKLKRTPPKLDPEIVKSFVFWCDVLWQCLVYADTEVVDLRQVTMSYVCTVVLFYGFIGGEMNHPPTVKIGANSYLRSVAVELRDVAKFSYLGQPFKNDKFVQTYKIIQSCVLWWNAKAFQSTDRIQRPLSLAFITKDIPVPLLQYTASTFDAPASIEHDILSVDGTITRKSILAPLPMPSTNDASTALTLTTTATTPYSRASHSNRPVHSVIGSLDLISHLL